MLRLESERNFFSRFKAFSSLTKMSENTSWLKKSDQPVAINLRKKFGFINDNSLSYQANEFELPRPAPRRSCLLNADRNSIFREVPKSKATSGRQLKQPGVHLHPSGGAKYSVAAAKVPQKKEVRSSLLRPSHLKFLSGHPKPFPIGTAQTSGQFKLLNATKATVSQSQSATAVPNTLTDQEASTAAEICSTAELQPDIASSAQAVTAGASTQMVSTVQGATDATSSSTTQTNSANAATTKAVSKVKATTADGSTQTVSTVQGATDAISSFTTQTASADAATTEAVSKVQVTTAVGSIETVSTVEKATPAIAFGSNFQSMLDSLKPIYFLMRQFLQLYGGIGGNLLLEKTGPTSGLAQPCTSTSANVAHRLSLTMGCREDANLEEGSNPTVACLITFADSVTKDEADTGSVRDITSTTPSAQNRIINRECATNPTAPCLNTPADMSDNVDHHHSLSRGRQEDTDLEEDSSPAAACLITFADSVAKNVGYSVRDVTTTTPSTQNGIINGEGAQGSAGSTEDDRVSSYSEGPNGIRRSTRLLAAAGIQTKEAGAKKKCGLPRYRGGKSNL